MSITFYNLFRLLFGTLYPAYASYKAVKTKNVKEYVKWMMYWIVFAFFSCIETFADIFIAWMPFYYELKILFVLWLLSPATKGSSILYRKLVHPQLSKREKDIDGYINKASDQGYSALLSVGSRGFSYASNMLLSTAIKGQTKLVDQLKKSYSLSDVSNMDDQDQVLYLKDEDEDETDNMIIEESYCDEMKIDRPERVKKDKNAKERHRGDNRLIEEQYQREMMEKEDLGGRREKPHKRRTNLNQQDMSQDDGEVTIRRTKTNYSHKEAEPPKLQRPLSYPGHRGSKPKSAYVSPLMHRMLYSGTPSKYVSPYLSANDHPSDDEFEEYEYKRTRSGSVSSVSSEGSVISQASSYMSTSSRPSISRRESDVSPRRKSESEEPKKSKAKVKVDMGGSKSPSTWRHRVNAAESRK